MHSVLKFQMFVCRLILSLACRTKKHDFTMVSEKYDYSVLTHVRYILDGRSQSFTVRRSGIDAICFSRLFFVPVVTET